MKKLLIAAASILLMGATFGDGRCKGMSEQFSGIGGTVSGTSGAPAFSPAPYAYWSMADGLVAGQIPAAIGTTPIVVSGASMDAGVSPRGGAMLTLGVTTTTSTATISGVSRPLTYGFWFRLDTVNPFYNSALTSLPALRGLEAVINIEPGPTIDTVSDAFRFSGGAPLQITTGQYHYAIFRANADGSLSINVDGTVQHDGLAAGEIEAGTPTSYALGVRSDNVLPLNGAIGDIAFWSTRLSDADIAAAQLWITTGAF